MNWEHGTSDSGGLLSQEQGLSTLQAVGLSRVGTQLSTSVWSKLLAYEAGVSRRTRLTPQDSISSPLFSF